MLVTSIFSFSHNVLKGFIFLLRLIKSQVKVYASVSHGMAHIYFTTFFFSFGNLYLEPVHAGVRGYSYPVNPFPYMPRFLCVCSTTLLKTLWEKEKLIITTNFSISHSVFYPFGELSAIFIKFEIVVCKPFQFGRV